MAVSPLFGGQLVSVDGPAGFGVPPAGGSHYISSFMVTDDAPIDAVFTVTQTGGVKDYFFIVDLNTPSTDHELIGLAIDVGFGAGEIFTPANWSALKIGNPWLDFVAPPDPQDNHVTWSPSLGFVFNEDNSTISLFYSLSVPDPDAAFVPADFQIHENGNLTGYEFTLRYTATFVPEPTSSWVCLVLMGLAFSRHARIERR